MHRAPIPPLSSFTETVSAAYDIHLLRLPEPIQPAGNLEIIHESGYSSWRIPQTLEEVPQEWSESYRRLATEGLFRSRSLDYKKQRVTITDLKQTNNDLVEYAVASDAHISKLDAKVKYLKNKRDEESERADIAEQDRDHYKEKAEKGNFGGLLNKATFKEKGKIAIEKDERTATAGKPKVFGFYDVLKLDRLNSILTESVVDDEVLEPIGLIITENQRLNDLAGAWGGDEFTELLQNITVEEAILHFKRLQAKITEIKVNPMFAGGENVDVIITIGFARAREGDTYADVEARASRAKEYAKHFGDSRIVNIDEVPEDWVSTRKDHAS